MTSRKKLFMRWALYAVNKKPGIAFRWSLVALYRWSLNREKFDLKTLGRTTKWSLRTGGCFKKMVVKTGLTAYSTLKHMHAHCQQATTLSCQIVHNVCWVSIV